MQFIIHDHHPALFAGKSQKIPSLYQRICQLQNEPGFAGFGGGNHIHDFSSSQKTIDYRFIERSKCAEQFCCGKHILLLFFMGQVCHDLIDIFQNGIGLTVPLFNQGIRRRREISVMFQQSIDPVWCVALIGFKWCGVGGKNIEVPILQSRRYAVAFFAGAFPILTVTTETQRCPTVLDENFPDIATGIVVIAGAQGKTAAGTVCKIFFSCSIHMR